MTQFDLAIKPFECSGLNHTLIRVSLDYDKKIKGPYVSFQTAAIEKYEDALIFRVVIFASPRRTLVMDRDWPRNNKKRMQEAADQLQDEITNKKGDAWAAITDLLTECKSELISEEK